MAKPPVAELGAPVLILRPQPGASATARRARSAGLSARVAPLFRAEPLDWTMSAPCASTAVAAAAVLITSAFAVRSAGPGLAQVAHLPVLAVGSATARAARRAGLRVIHIGSSTADSVLASGAAQGFDAIYWLCGAVRTNLIDPRLVAVAVYRMVPTAGWRGAAMLDASAHIIMVHSAAAAELLAAHVAGATRGAHHIVAISAAVAAAAGAGWRSVAVAPSPTDADMLEISGKLCQ